MHLRGYDQEYGLSSYNVRKIFQDSKGFIWVATQEGLDRFDGNNFISYKKNTTPKHTLSGIDVRAISEDTINNLLWVLSAENVINAINVQSGNVVRSIALRQDDPNDWNLSMGFVGKKIIAGSLVGAKIYNSENGNFLGKLPLPVIGNNATDALETRCIKTDPYGNVWVSYGGYGIAVYNKALNKIAALPLEVLKLPKGVNVVWFNNIIFRPGNEALIATSKGLRKIKFDAQYTFSVDDQPCKNVPLLNSMPVEDVTGTTSGEVYIAGIRSFYKFDAALLNYTIFKEAETEAKGSWLADVLTIFQDRSNNIWLGCKQGLAFMPGRNRPFQAFYWDNVSGNKLEHVMGIYKPENDSLLVSLLNGFSTISKNTGRATVSAKDYTFHHIFEDRLNRYHVSRSDGMFIYDKGILKPVKKIYPEFTDSFSSCRLNSHAFIGDSLLVLGTENNNGIFIWNYNKHTIRKINEKSSTVRLASGIVNKVYLDSSGNLWVLSDNTISIIEKGFLRSASVRPYNNDRNQHTGLYFDVCEANGYYWVAAYGAGIIQLDRKMNVVKIYTTLDGLTNDGVYQLYPYKGKLIITSNYGLSVFDLATKAFQNYYWSDGLHSNGFEEAAGMMKDDVIYAGGLKGFTIIQPGLLSGNASPPLLYLNRIILETQKAKVDTANLDFHKFAVPNNTLQTNIYFSALNYSNPTRTTYAYRIRERSKDWINLSTQNFVTLIGLAPGTYHLQVKAANEDGVWSEPKELVLVFLPKWYQAGWFKLLVVLAIAGMMYALYRYRIRQIKKQHEIRRNIATDLHDDLGSTLNSVKVFTNLAISGVNQDESLQQIKDNLKEATTGLRDMIWVLDDSLDTVDELVTRLKQFALPVAAASNIEVDIKTEPGINSKQLTKEEKRNLFLVCKEAINNSIKYAGASRIDININSAGKKIRISITDNGKGFNEATVKKGYGLKNMQYRSNQVKYKTSIQSVPGEGTTITIFPA